MDTFEALKTEIFNRQTVLSGIYRGHGGQSLENYVNSWPITPGSELTKIFIKKLTEVAGRYYEPAVSEAVGRQLAECPLLSTIDHHGLLNHPFFINSNLIFGQRRDLKFLICLATAGVSLNNSSWPGSLLAAGAGGNICRFSFFPDRFKTETVLAARAINFGDVRRVLLRIKHDSRLGSPEKLTLTGLVEEIFTAEVYAQKDFSAQACLLSPNLWAKIFPSAPPVIYLPLEEVVAKVLSEVIAADAAHPLCRLLFTSGGWDLVEKYFTGSPGAFSPAHKGSFIFWAIDGKGRRAHLRRAGLKITGDAPARFVFGPGDLASALSNRQIYPGSLACFLVLLYYQITTVGGFNQVNWLSAIREKFAALLAELGLMEMSAAVGALPTKNFAEGNLAFLPAQNGLYKAGGMDLFLTGRDYYQKFRLLAENLTVGQSLESLLPEIYRVVTPAQERSAELSAVSDLEIAAKNGMAGKITGILKDA